MNVHSSVILLSASAVAQVTKVVIVAPAFWILL